MNGMREEGFVELVASNAFSSLLVNNGGRGCSLIARKKMEE